MALAMEMAMAQKREPPVYEPGSDLRLDFVYGYITRSFRSKPDKWKSFLQNEDYKAMLYDFFDNADTTFLVINVSPEGTLIPLDSFPSVGNTKSVYMLKKTPVAFSSEEYYSFRDGIIVGDLPPKPLEALMTFVEEVIRPTVTSEVNQDKWPETVVTDLKQQTTEICSVLYTVQGQLRGKTLLPMPVNLEQIEENEKRLEQGGPGEVDLQLRTSLETLVIKWSQQINEVLQKDPSKPLKDGLNPSPYVELAYWEERVQDLKCIYSQLNDDKVRKLANILEKTDSTYWPCFKSMFRNVVAALAEAQDILAHLKPLRRYLDICQNIRFSKLADQVEALMHCVCLIWGHSRYYCSPARIIDLLQEICNMLIIRARNYLDGTTIFQSTPYDGQKKARAAMNTLKLFRDLYDAYKSELPVYFSKDSEAKNWDFLPHLVFARYDKYLERLGKIQEFFDTSVEFYDLETVDIGGNKGKYLSANIQDLHSNFLQFFQSFSDILYDCADPDDTYFEKDYKRFQDEVNHMDKRLSAIVISGFAASDTPEAIYKFITTMGELLKRPIVKADFELQYPVYVRMLDNEMSKVKEVYDKIIIPFSVTERNQIFPQYPPYSASVYWAKGMRDQIDEDMEQFRTLDLKIEDKEALELLNDKYQEIGEILDKLMTDSYSEWKKVVDKEGEKWLKEHLFGKTKEDGTLVVNFNHELYGTLKEVQYMEMAGFTDIPGSASKIYGEKEIFRKNLSFLDEVAHSYNKMLRNANNAEKEVLKGKFKAIDTVLKEGKESITWSDSGSKIWNYVQKLRSPVQDLLEKFQESQDNVAALKKLLLQWVSRPLFERRESTDDNNKLLRMDDEAYDRKIQQYKEIEEASIQVHELVAKNRELLFDSNTGEGAWKGYLNYIDGIVKDALIRTAAVSVGYIADHTDPTLTPGPLFEMVMELDDTGITFFPALESSASHSFMNLVEDILLDAFNQGSLVKRVKHAGGVEDYVADIEASQNISEMHNDISERVTAVTNQVRDYVQRFSDYSNIWDDDKKEYLRQFLKYGRQLTQEEIDAKFAGLEIPTKEPTLDQFREVIDKFEKLYLDVERFAQETIFDRWFRLNMRSFRQSVLNNCKRWSYMFKEHLMETVVGGLQDLDDFCRGAQVGLTRPLNEGDTKTLISVMKWLQQMKERQVNTDNMFEPIKEYIELLKMYEYEPPEQVYVQLDQLPQKWNKIKKLAIQVKHQVGPLLVKEVAAIRKRIADFDKTQHEFRERFKEFDFFKRDCQAPYASIDQAHLEIAALENEHQELCEQAELFEIIVPEPKQLRSCPRELRFAKGIWDCISIVESFHDDYTNKTSHWKAVLNETMIQEVPRLRRDAKGMDIDLKTWEIFTTLEFITKTTAP